MSGMPEKQTYGYVGHGCTILFAALNIADGTVIWATHRPHRSMEFHKISVEIDTEVPVDLAVHVICDNYGTSRLNHPGPGSRFTRGSGCDQLACAAR